MQRPINRIQPAGPVHSYKTYEISAPEATHFRDASCEETACQHWSFGWRTIIDETAELGGRQAAYIRSHSNRMFVEVKENGMTVFEFPPGETCFTAHKLPLERDPFFLVRGGDWRGNPRGELRIHDNPDSWVNDFAEHQDRINTTLNG